jgi:uncharacterized protein (UPF0276 family)
VNNYNSFSPISANSVGIGLRYAHHQYILDSKPEIPWFEVHSENYYADGGPAINFLKKIRELYPLSLHSVGLSLGSCQKLDKKHLKKLKNLANIIKPFLISDHISWSNIDGISLNDLLPIPYTKEALKVLCDNISQTQDYLKTEILVENPSTYLSFQTADFSEDQFINQTAKITGCKILLDVNNIYVSSENNNFDAVNYINNIDKNIVGEMHLAGHSVTKFKNKKVLIDTHNNLVCDEVWELYKIAARKFNQVPTLIEWDQDLPDFQVLIDEAKKAQKIISA